MAGHEHYFYLRFATNRVGSILFFFFFFCSAKGARGLGAAIVGARLFIAAPSRKVFALCFVDRSEA